LTLSNNRHYGKIIHMNNQTRKKLVLFDIDGTLFDNVRMCIPESTKKALAELHKTAHIGIATGRAGFMLYSVEEILPLVDYLILINGQYIKAKERIIYENSIEPELLANLVRDMEGYGIAHGFVGSDDEAISKIDNKVIQSFQGLGLHLPPLNPEFHLKRKVYMAWAFCNEEIASDLMNKHPEFAFIRWLDVGYDILPRQASKGLGMKHLVDFLKIDREDVVAFGDGDNDYELLRDAGLGIAMGNGTFKVKGVADYITAPVHEDGIFLALKHFGLIK
jgi:Cof subfamily protein (haloacid dehalogenase superfamily)